MKAIQQESTSSMKKKKGPTDKTSRLNQRRMTIMESVAAKQKKAEFTNLEKDFKKKFQSLSKTFISPIYLLQNLKHFINCN